MAGGADAPPELTISSEKPFCRQPVVLVLSGPLENRPGLVLENRSLRNALERQWMTLSSRLVGRKILQSSRLRAQIRSGRY